MYHTKSISEFICDLQSYYGACPKRPDEISIWTRVPFKSSMPKLLLSVHKLFATDDWIQVSFLLALGLILIALSLEIREIYRILVDQAYQPDSFVGRVRRKSSLELQRSFRGFTAAVNIVSTLLLLFGLLNWNSNYNLFWILMNLVAIPINFVCWSLLDKTKENLMPILISTLQLVIVCHVTMIIAATNFKIINV